MGPSMATGGDIEARAQLSKLTALSVMSMMMFDHPQETAILRLAVTTVPTLGQFTVAAGFRLGGGRPTRISTRALDPGAGVEEQLEQLTGGEDPVGLEGLGWGR